jgi:uncharacterized protein with HEPN domain
MSQHDDAVYLRHMLDHAQEALRIAAGKDRASLDTEPMLRYSLLHLVTVLGEATNRLSAPARTKYKIPWRDIIAMRNRLIHGYDTVDRDLLWKTVETDLPALIETLRPIVGPEEAR